MPSSVYSTTDTPLSSRPQRFKPSTRRPARSLELALELSTLRAVGWSAKFTKIPPQKPPTSRRVGFGSSRTLILEVIFLWLGLSRIFEFVTADDRTVSIPRPFKNFPIKPRDSLLSKGSVSDVLYLWYDEFGFRKSTWFYSEVLDAAEDRNPAVVIDLRDNVGGGLVWVATDLGELIVVISSQRTFAYRLARPKKC